MSYSNVISEIGHDPFPDGVKRYIAQTYTYFFASLLSMAVLGVVSYLFLPTTSLIGLAIADSIIWILCGWFGWRNPMLLVFPLFSIITGLLLGQLAHLYTNVVFVSTIITLVAFFGLTAFVWFTKWDFSFLAGFLCLAFFVLLGGWIASFFISEPGFLLVWTGFGVVTFGCWILYDTSNVLNRAGDGVTPDIAGFELIIDIIGFHRWLLDRLNLWNVADN